MSNIMANLQREAACDEHDSHSEHHSYVEHHDSQTDSQSAYSSRPSSPESRSVHVRSPIPEEDEETSSENVNEPTTPTDPQHSQSNTRIALPVSHNGSLYKAISARPPLILNTSATPPPSPGIGADTPRPGSVKGRSTWDTTTKKRSPSKDSTGLRRAVTSFFKRSNSTSEHNLKPFTPLDHFQQSEPVPIVGSDPTMGRDNGRLSNRPGSTGATPLATRSNTPPSPGTISNSVPKNFHNGLAIVEDDYMIKKKLGRSSTGLNLRDRLHIRKVAAVAPEQGQKQGARATSVDLNHAIIDGSDSDHPDPEVQNISRQVWGMAAETGIGLKSRRMSLSLPDGFNVDTVELYSEYQDQSKIVGRRGKHLGKGATANVKLMKLKHGASGELFAVKEFRGKSSAEQAEDYEKKVKSEYYIAKSAHHPNIVETLRLCTHHGRWNQVMEYCEQGDLFSLVNQKYLAREDHLVDRLCLFKQLVQGIHYLHSNGIAHRDVKLENLLVTKDSKLKITDFGVSEVFTGQHPGLRSAGGQCGKDMGEIRLCAPGICGSPPYIAPEVIAKQGEYDPRPLDVWGAAIVMLCMCANGCLWGEAKLGSSPLYDDLVRGWVKWNEKHADANTTISETDYPHVAFFDNHINPPALRRVLLTMLNPDPARRASIAEVAQNRWLKNLECCQIDSYDDPAKVIDATKSKFCKAAISKVVQHNHLPPHVNVAHKLVRLPGSTDM